MKDNAIAVVSANFGAYDTVKFLPQVEEAGIDYFYVSDNNDVLSDATQKGWRSLKCDWKGVPVPEWAIENASRYQAKAVKFAPWAFPPEKYRHYVWIDSSMTLQSYWWQPALNYLGAGDLLLHLHRERDTAYEEAALSSLRPQYADERTALLQAIVQMGSVGLPTTMPLYEAGFIMRRHTARQDDLARLWWQAQEKLKTTQDQVTLAWALWESGVDVSTFPFTLPDNGKASQIVHIDFHAPKKDKR